MFSAKRTIIANNSILITAIPKGYSVIIVYTEKCTREHKQLLF